jgi:hypothetical protein
MMFYKTANKNVQQLLSPCKYRGTYAWIDEVICYKQNYFLPIVGTLSISCFTKGNNLKVTTRDKIALSKKFI